MGPNSHRDVKRAMGHVYTQWVALWERKPQPRETKSCITESKPACHAPTPKKDSILILLDSK